MTVQTPALFNQTGSYPAVQLRQLIAALSPPGILKSTDLLVSALVTPNMSVNVAGGSAVIAGTEATTQGSYLFFNDATVNVPIAASDPTNPRNDLIVAVIRDAADYSGANNDSRLIAVTGTPAASPADPAVPNNAVVLARVRVDATVTTIVAGKVTDLRSARGPTLGYQQVVAIQGSITTDTDLTGLAVTVTVGAGRRIRISAQAIVSTNAGTAIAQLRIKEGATQLQQANRTVPTGDDTITSGVILSPSAGAHTYKLSLGPASAVTLSMDANAVTPAYILVEDIGI